VQRPSGTCRDLVPREAFLCEAAVWEASRHFRQDLLSTRTGYPAFLPSDASATLPLGFGIVSQLDDSAKGGPPLGATDFYTPGRVKLSAIYL